MSKQWHCILSAIAFNLLHYRTHKYPIYQVGKYKTPLLHTKQALNTKQN